MLPFFPRRMSCYGYVSSCMEYRPFHQSFLYTLLYAVLKLRFACIFECARFRHPATCLQVEDYWQGYKLYCYAYYLYSSGHVSEFRATKLGEQICSFLLAHAIVGWCYLAPVQCEDSCA